MGPGMVRKLALALVVVGVLVALALAASSGDPFSR